MPESAVPARSGPEHAVDSEAVRSLHALINGVEAFTTAIGARFGLSTSENVAMRELAVRGQLTPGELATRTGLTSSSVTNLVDRLERIGLVRRGPHPADRRSVLVEVTDEGHAALSWARSLLVHAYDDIAPADRVNVMAALRSIAAELEKQALLVNRREC